MASGTRRVTLNRACSNSYLYTIIHIAVRADFLVGNRKSSEYYMTVCVTNATTTPSPDLVFFFFLSKSSVFLFRITVMCVMFGCIAVM